MSAECDKCGTDLVGTQWDGLTCPVCERADQIVADTALLEECREALKRIKWRCEKASTWGESDLVAVRLAQDLLEVFKPELAQLNKRLEAK